VLKIPVTGPPITPNQLGWIERGLRCLGGTALTEGDKTATLLLLSGYVRSDATLAASLAEGDFGTEAADEAMASYGRLLRKLLDPARFPALTRAVEAGVFDAPGVDDEDFEFGLERILDGIEALVGQREA
jgi:Tetracyclin repressor-like, C-terminal domain